MYIFWNFLWDMKKKLIFLTDFYGNTDDFKIFLKYNLLKIAQKAPLIRSNIKTIANFTTWNKYKSIVTLFVFHIVFYQSQFVIYLFNFFYKITKV